MREGLLWYDADRRRTPQARLDEALQRYRERFGTAANVCHVAPAEVFVHPEVAVVGDPAVLPHHFVVGFDETRVETPLPRRARAAGAVPVAPPAPVAMAEARVEIPTTRRTRAPRGPTPVASVAGTAATAAAASPGVAAAAPRPERGRRQRRSA